MLGLGEQVGERVGIRRVAGLGALGLGHAELVEQHLLQLLGAAEVDVLAADGVVGVLLGLAHLRGEVGLELGQGRLVDGDAGALHPREDVDERQLEVAQQLGAAGLLEPLGEHRRQLEHGARPHHGVAGRGVVVGREVEHPLRARGLLGLELAAQVAHHEVLEVVGALVGAHEVGGERGVAGDPGQLEPARRQGLELFLGVVQHLGRRRVGEPPGQDVLLVGGQRREVEVGGGAVGAGQGDGTGIPVAAAVAADDHQAVRHRAPDGAVAEAHREVVGGEDVALEVEAALDLVLLDVEGREEPLAQHPELQAVEDPVHLLAVPGLALEVVDRQRQLEVVDQPVEPAVAQHAVEVLAQAVAGLALDLVDVGDDPGEVAVLPQPLGGGLRPDAWNAGQVVARLADQGREVAVALGRHEVLLGDRGRVHPPHLGHPPHGVDQADRVADQLEGVAVAGADDHLGALGDGLRGEGGDDVVGLEALDADVPDAQRVEHLAQQRQLPGELGGRGRAAGLVLGVLGGPEGLAGDVEGHADVGGRLVAQHVDQHRGEAVDGVRVLAGARREVLDGQGEEGAVGQRVSVEEEELHA